MGEDALGVADGEANQMAQQGPLPGWLCGCSTKLRTNPTAITRTTPALPRRAHLVCLLEHAFLQAMMRLSAECLPRPHGPEALTVAGICWDVGALWSAYFSTKARQLPLVRNVSWGDSF